MVSSVPQRGCGIASELAPIRRRGACGYVFFGEGNNFGDLETKGLPDTM